MIPRELFEANLSLIERVIERVCRVAKLTAADAEDFASCARLHLMQNDFEVLRQHDGRASLASYISVVLQRLLIDMRNRELGRWRPSAEAQRMGACGILLEKLMERDLRSLAEAVPIVLGADSSLTPQDVAAMAARLPKRPRRPRQVELDEKVETFLPSRDDTAARVEEAERRRLADRMSRVLRDSLATMTAEDRVIVGMRFGGSMTITDISRMLGLPQRPMFRRVEALLARLRKDLLRAGIGGGEAEEVIGMREVALDAGLSMRAEPEATSLGAAAASAGGES